MTEPKDVVKTNAPRIIYLQDGGGEPLPRERYDEQVTWCGDSIEDDDTKYIRFDQYERDLTAARAALADRDEELELVEMERSSAASAATTLLTALGWSSGGLAAAAQEIVTRAEKAEAALAAAERERDAMKARAESAEGDWQVAERKLAERAVNEERYLWLREHINYRDVQKGGMGGPAAYKARIWSHESYQLQADTLDSAIDAALAAAGGEA